MSKVFHGCPICNSNFITVMLNDITQCAWPSCWKCGFDGHTKEDKKAMVIELKLNPDMDDMKLFGEATRVYAVDRTGLFPDADYDIEEASAVSMQFENSVFGVMFSACFIQAGMRRSGLDIFCQDGSIEYRLRKSLTLSTAEGEHLWEAKNPYTLEMDRTFIEAVRSGDGSKIRSPYADAVKSAELSIAANQSLLTGQAIHLTK